MNYREIISSIEPGKRSGKPCIRGMRITVYDVLDYLASGMSVEDVLRDFPYLTRGFASKLAGAAASTCTVRAAAGLFTGARKS